MAAASSDLCCVGTLGEVPVLPESLTLTLLSLLCISMLLISHPLNAQPFVRRGGAGFDLNVIKTGEFFYLLNGWVYSVGRGGIEILK